jgi:DNA-binding PadR family transcriptional regulator
MGRVKQTHLAVLGALGVRPMTGYALREAFQDALGHFWSESFGQIYPALNELTDAGFIEKRPGDRAGSSVYTLTDSGRRQLLDLLNQPPTPVPPRNGLMLRLFFGHALGPEACKKLILDARETARRQLETYAGIRAGMAAEEEDTEHHPYWLLTVSAGEHTAWAAVAWAEESLAALEKLPA